MNSSPTCLAIALNNEGLEYLEAQRFESAIQCISQALEIVKGELANPTGTSSNDGSCATQGRVSVESCDSMQDDQVNGACPQHRSLAPILHFDNHRNAISPSNDDDDDEDGKPWVSTEAYVFDKPIGIDLPLVFPPSSSTRPCHKYVVSLAFVLVFNLALTYHLHALEEEGKDTANMNAKEEKETRRIQPKRLYQKAMTLYEMAYSVQIHEDAINTSLLQTMAMVNNLGHIHAKLGNEEKSQHCFENLLVTMMFVAQVSSCCSEEDELNVKEACLYMNDFLTNVLPLILKHPQVACAA